MDQTQFFAHSAGADGRWEPMLRHVRWVADLAAENGSSFGSSEECRFASILHDLGKYGTRFQDRLRGTAKHIDHWSAGAWEAALAGPKGFASALAIQGHHIGLQRGDRESLAGLNIRDLGSLHPLGCVLSDDSQEAIRLRAQADGCSWTAPTGSCFDWARRETDPVGQMLAVRMLFSALVDADFIATERHFDGLASSEERRSSMSIDARAAYSSLVAYVDRLARRSKSSVGANDVRRQLFDACLSSGCGRQGLFTLNAPTGSGKTLAMLGWAISQCLAHSNLSRIIVVLPYLTIMDQTAKAYRDCLADWLPDDVSLSRGILEHHSLASWKSLPCGRHPSDEQGPVASHLRFLAENWDAPIVVTSTVQFFESLFANSPSACRKLHRIANSVILLDEVQTFNPSLILPTLGALSTLTTRFGCSVVLATATQPAFSHLSSKVKAMAAAGYDAKPIIADPKPLFSAMRRTRVQWPAAGETSNWDRIADRMVDAKQALCIVNLKRHAQSLFDALRDRQRAGVLHLSTLMCPDHRLEVLKEVEKLLASCLGCLLVATQCVEAGVDLDFPLVLRAFGPLDSIAQAAGRCNRNGNCDYGDVRVFKPEDSGRLYPDGAYEQAAMVTAELLNRHGGSLDIDDPDIFIEYFRSLYELGVAESGNDELITAVRTMDFLRVAKLYRIIDSDTISVVTPWSVSRFAELSSEVRSGCLSRGWIQRVRGLTVNIFRPRPNAPEWSHLEPVPIGPGKMAQDWFLLNDPDDYDERAGLRFQSGLAMMEG